MQQTIVKTPEFIPELEAVLEDVVVHVRRMGHSHYGVANAAKNNVSRLREKLIKWQHKDKERSTPYIRAWLDLGLE